MIFIDTNGKSFDIEKNEYLFEQKVNNNLTIIYQQTEVDIDLLLNAMAMHGMNLKEIDSKEALLKGRCTRRNGRCTGTCSRAGHSCKKFDSGNFSGCKCY